MGDTVVRFVGHPDGPKVYVPELGCEVGTFTEQPGGKREALRHHVPLQMRGDFRPQDLANYSSEKHYRTDQIGKVLCYAFKSDGERCSKRAQNRYPRCVVHGGRLHPLDKTIQDEEKATNQAEGQGLSRYRQFVAGQITVDDLDDEELAACGFRASNGRIYKPRNVPREMAQGFVRAIYERAQAELRSHAVTAAQTMAEIMMNKNVEPDVRLKAASTLLDRNLGKAPQVVQITNQAPWEEIFDEIAGGSRERSRNSRAITSERILEAEVIEPHNSAPNDNNDSTIGDASSTSGRQSDTGHSEQNHGPSQESTLGVGSECIDVVEEPRDAGLLSDPVTDARLFARDEAILAQTIEIKPFEYDLSDHSKEIKEATKKRYVAKHYEHDVALERIETVNSDGTIHVIHKPPKPKAPNQSQAIRRKSYTLSDFD